MKITEVSIKNFRTLKDITVPLTARTVVVGENNGGKSAFFDLLEKVLSPTSRGIQFQEDDFHHDVDPHTASIEVNIEIRPDTGIQFSSETRAAFFPHVDVDAVGADRLVIRVMAQYDADFDGIRATARFVKDDGQQDSGYFLNFRKHLPFFMIDSIRDARREFSSGQGLWSRLARTTSIAPDKAEEISTIGLEAGQKVLETALGDAQFGQLIAELKTVLGSALWSGNTVGSFDFSFIPSEFRDLFRNLELRLQNPADTRSLPLMDHGVGTQSLMVLALFTAYTHALGYTDPILAVEEPEAHLHPQAQRAIVRQLFEIGTQTLISTHSTFVTDQVKPSEIILLRRQGNQTRVKLIPPGYLDAAEESTLARYIRGESSEFYFARSVLLVEGEGEKAAIPVFARAMNLDLDKLGVSVVRVNGGAFKPFMKVFDARAFSIPWILLADNDRVAADCLKYAVQLGLLPAPDTVLDLETRRIELESQGIHFYPIPGDFEVFVLRNGFEAEYELAIEEVHGAGALASWLGHSAPNIPGLATMPRWEQIDRFITSRGRKPELAGQVALHVTNQGTDDTKIPAYYRQVIEAAVQKALAG